MSEIARSYCDYIFQLFKEAACCSPQWLYQFTFPPTMQEGSLFCTPSPAFLVCRFFDDSHSHWCEVVIFHYRLIQNMGRRGSDREEIQSVDSQLRQRILVSGFGKETLIIVSVFFPSLSTIKWTRGSLVAQCFTQLNWKTGYVGMILDAILYNWNFQG